MRVVILGAGGHGQVVADIFRVSGTETFEIVGFLDDGWQARPAQLGIRVLGPLSALPTVPHDAVVIAVGDNADRASLCRVHSDEKLVTAQHPRAVVSPDAIIGDGSMICAGAIVNTGTAIGHSVILNTGCTVDHHSVVGDFAHIAPGVHMGGEVHIGEGAFVGIGAVVLPRIRIGAWSTVGAGAVVIRDVPDGATVVGNPARPIRRAVSRSA